MNFNECLVKFPLESGNINDFRNCVYKQCVTRLMRENGGVPVDGETIRNSEYGKAAARIIHGYAINTCRNPSHYTKIPLELVKFECEPLPGNSFYIKHTT